METAGFELFQLFEKKEWISAEQMGELGGLYLSLFK